MIPIGSTTSAQQAAAPQLSATARAADGDFLTKGAGHTVKDADGDYKPSAAGVSAVVPTAKVSASVQAALASLTKGG